MNALILSAILGVLMMFSGILIKKASAIRAIAIAGMLVLLMVSVWELNGKRLFQVDTAGMLYFDRFTMLFHTVSVITTLIFLFLSASDMEKVGLNYAEYFALIFFIICGIILITSFQSLLILFLGIEIISIPLYILTGSDRKNLKSNEAALKYFLLGAFSTGLMLMGIALMYGAQGTFGILLKLSEDKGQMLLTIAGMLFLLFSMAFKVSVAPFHFWTPDVYDGAPTVFTSFMATIVKAAIFISFIRLFGDAFGVLHSKWKLFVALLTVATLCIGNITAVFQQSVKRMMAYSSIAQAGFMMLSLYALNTEAKEGLLLYVVAYSLATVGIFAVLVKMSDYTISGFNGLAKYQPLLAATTTIFLLSLAGIPLTAGFLSKFYLLKATIASGNNIWLVVVAIVMAAISTYYYFRIIQAMYFKEGDNPGLHVNPPFKWTLVALAAMLVLLGMFPNLLLYWVYF